MSPYQTICRERGIRCELVAGRLVLLKLDTSECVLGSPLCKVTKAGISQVGAIAGTGQQECRSPHRCRNCGKSQQDFPEPNHCGSGEHV